MRCIVVALLLIACCVAQTGKPIKSRALKSCEIQLSDSEQSKTAYVAVFDEYLDQINTLGKSKQELEAKNAELTKKLDDLQAAGSDVLAYAQRLDAEYKALTVVYDAMVKQLNSSADAMVERNTRAAERMAAAQEQNAKINRSMALFTVMQGMKTQPLPMPPAPILSQPRVRVNCTSSSLGNTVYTDCN
jgi:predicted nuclease with TOPRIM domain